MISLCMIVKNEENYIEHCLASVKDSVDEIVIVDTGSTDRTIEICESFGAKIVRYDWIDDFSAARNYGIDQAKGDWILVLDADEYLDEMDAGRLREYVSFLDKEDFFASFTIRYDYFQDGSWDEADIIRLFRNLDSIRYKGAVYESVRIKKAKVFIDRNRPIKLHHLGFLKSENTIVSKRSMYMKITESSLRLSESENKLFYWEAQDALIHGEMKKAIEICKTGISKCPDSKRLVELLGRLYIKTRNYEMAETCLLQVIEMAENEKKEKPDEKSKFGIRARNDMVELLFVRGNYEQALEIINSNIKLEPSAYSYINKSMILLEIGQIDEARSCMELARKINPHIFELECGEKSKFSCLARTFQAYAGYKELLKKAGLEVQDK